MYFCLSINSDIGTALAMNWRSAGNQVAGTYRHWNDNCEKLQGLGVELYHLDLGKRESIDSFFTEIRKQISWDVLVCAAGTLKPIGLFEEIDEQEWEFSLHINFISQAIFVKRFLNYRNLAMDSTVLMFAGGGTNSATERYSAYTLAKIATIKFCELMNHEIQQTKFVAIGPGWVNTKIHNETLESKEAAGFNFEITNEKKKDNSMTPIDYVVDCIDRVIKMRKSNVGGRNISVAYDNWRSDEFENQLINQPDSLKLRRRND
jgi:NAD(P)-dependent dehydrogenase (short-subunit alcohol dehydrogenase family)